MEHQRRMLTRGLLAAAALAFAAGPAVAAEATGFNGTWAASFDSQVGVQTYTYTFKVEGGKLTGRAKSDAGDYEIANGKVEGDKISFVENMDYQGMALAISYEGRLTSADEIQFKRDVAGQGGEEFTAKRQS